MEYLAKKSRFLFCKIAHLPVSIMKHILINGISCKKSRLLFCKIAHLIVQMEHFAKKVVSQFLQDFAFSSIDEGYTNKWYILQKKSFSFLQDGTFSSNDEGYTNKWNILQKSRFLF